MLLVRLLLVSFLKVQFKVLGMISKDANGFGQNILAVFFAQMNLLGNFILLKRFSFGVAPSTEIKYCRLVTDEQPYKMWCTDIQTLQ